MNRRFRYLGYAAGDSANNLTFSMISAFLLIYYTDVAGISAATAGTLFLVVRVWGGISDLIAGRAVDKTNARWGRFRPYLVIASIPLLLSFVALFSIPSGLGVGATVVWAYVTYALFSLAYSFVNIPYGSLAAVMTQDPEVRARLSTVRSIAASVTILLIAVVVSPQISAGGDLQRTLTITTIIFAVVSYLFYVWTFSVAEEKVKRSSEQFGVADGLRMIRQNRPLLLLCGSALLYLTGMFAVQTVAVYYARDVLGNADLYIVMTIVQTLAMVGASTLVPKAVLTHGKKKVYVMFGLVAVAGAIGVLLAPASVPALGIFFYGVIGAGFGAVNNLIFAFQPDTVDFGEWKSGIRAEGASYSLLSFTRKVGQGIGGAAAAYTISLGGYVSDAAEQTDAAITSIKVAIGAVPAVVMVAAMLIMLVYPLTEKALSKVVADLNERRESPAP